MRYLDPESRRTLWTLSIAVAFLYCGYRSWGELQYALQGRTAVATVTQVDYTTTCRKTQRDPRAVVQYLFTDTTGSPRCESDDIPQNADTPALGQTIDVQYRPGLPGQSRVAWHTHLLETATFLLMIAGGLLVVSLYYGFHVPAMQSGLGTFDGLAHSSER